MIPVLKHKVNFLGLPLVVDYDYEPAHKEGQPFSGGIVYEHFPLEVDVNPFVQIDYPSKTPIVFKLNDEGAALLGKLIISELEG